MDLAWPISVIPGSSALSLLDGSGRFSSPFTGTTRTVSRPGAVRLQLRLGMPLLHGAERADLQNFLASMDGASNRVWVWDHAYRQRGSFPATELLGDIDEAGVLSGIGADADTVTADSTAYTADFDAATGWTVSGELTLYATGGELRLTRTAVTASGYVYYSLSGLTSGAAYVARALMLPGKGSASWAIRVGSSAGANTYIDSTQQTAAGSARAAGVVSATAAYFSLYDYHTGRAAGDYQRFQAVSMSRCILVNGASQTGSALIVDKLPASTNGLLLPGDQVQIGDELKIVTVPLNSDSSGNGYLQFAPSLRHSPADNAPIIVYRPMGKFLLDKSENGWDSAPGIFSSAEVSLLEAVD